MLSLRASFSVLVCTFLSIAAFAQDGAKETWKCTYKGTETHTTVTPPETFDVSAEITWVGSSGSWTLSGKTPHATLTGTCDASSCKIDEKSDRMEYWEGAYSEEETEAKEHIDLFTGTWGRTPDDRKSGGTWQGKGTCTFVK